MALYELYYAIRIILQPLENYVQGSLVGQQPIRFFVIGEFCASWEQNFMLFQRNHFMAGRKYVAIISDAASTGEVWRDIEEYRQVCNIRRTLVGN